MLLTLGSGLGLTGLYVYRTYHFPARQRKPEEWSRGVTVTGMDTSASGRDYDV